MRLELAETFKAEGLDVREVYELNGAIYVQGSAPHKIGRGTRALATAVRKTTREKVPAPILARL